MKKMNKDEIHFLIHMMSIELLIINIYDILGLDPLHSSERVWISGFVLYIYTYIFQNIYIHIRNLSGWRKERLRAALLGEMWKYGRTEFWFNSYESYYREFGDDLWR